MIDCICCIMLHIFIYVWLCLSNSIDAHDVIKTAKKYRIHETSSPSVAAQVLQVPRGGSSLRLMGWQVNEGDKHAGDWLIVSSTLNWRYDIFASQFQYWLQDVSGVFIKFSIHIGCQKTKNEQNYHFNCHLQNQPPTYSKTSWVILNLVRPMAQMEPWTLGNAEYQIWL